MVNLSKVVLTVLLVTVLSVSPSAYAVNNIVVAVFAHPDDEITAAGTLAAFASKYPVHVIYLTSGMEGKDLIAGRTGAELGAVRREEAKQSLLNLGVTVSPVFLPYDYKMLTSFNDIVTTLENSFNQIKPTIVLSFAPDGISGHPEHFLAGVATTRAFDMTAFPQLLINPVFSVTRANAYTEVATYYHAEPNASQTVNDSAVNMLIDVSAYAYQRTQSMLAHKTQFGESNSADNLTWASFVANHSYEEFVTARRRGLEVMSSSGL